MQDRMRLMEVKILKALDGVEEPIAGADLLRRMHYGGHSTVSFYLQKLEYRGLVAPRHPYQHRSIVLTPAGRAAAAALAAKEAA
jgi:DNA-binding MarR family transcriptional regulator